MTKAHRFASWGLSELSWNCSETRPSGVCAGVGHKPQCLPVVAGFLIHVSQPDEHRRMVGGAPLLADLLHITVEISWEFQQQIISCKAVQAGALSANLVSCTHI